MLTTMYYYGYYKSYMIDNVENGVRSVSKREKITNKARMENMKDASFMLNKSLKTEVVKYAKDISQSVVGTKDAAKNLVRDMENFNRNTYKEDVDTAKRWVMEDLQVFADSYNHSVDFLLNQDHSRTLQEFGNSMASNFEFNGSHIQSLGLDMDETGKLNFQKNVFEQLDQSAINVAIGENINLFQTLYSDASNVLHMPLTDHMKFKNLSYYYNYKFGSMQSDTFKIVESGMLVDKAV